MSEPAGNQHTIYMARQPIYDRRMKVFAYELLYRGGPDGAFCKIGVGESADSIVRSLVEIGLDQLVGNHLAFINIPSYLLDHPALALIPRERVVLEILEDTEPTEENIESVQLLANMGFRLALDDYIPGAPQEAFLPFCKFVKLDLPLIDPSKLAETVADLKKRKLRVLAEKVETMEEFATCQAYGCDYFQGYFFAKPTLVAGRGMPSSSSVLVHLLTRLQDPMVTLEELENLVSVDVALTFRLLKLVNSVVDSSGHYVESVRKALMVLGLHRVVALVSLLALSGVRNKPAELLVTAMIRAKMCEGIASKLGYEASDKHFTVGLLSVMEAMFDTPMSELLAQLPLAKDLKDALGDPEAKNPLADSLRMALAFEAGNWDAVPETIAAKADVGLSYIEAVDWADETKKGSRPKASVGARKIESRHSRLLPRPRRVATVQGV